MSDHRDVKIAGVQGVSRLFDLIIDKLRSGLGVSAFNSQSKWLTVVGHYALLAAALLIFLYKITAAIKWESPIQLAYALGWILAIIVGQYIAVKFLPKVYAMIDARPTEIYTTAYLNVIVIVNLVAVGFVFISALYWTYRFEAVAPFWTGLGLVALCFYWAYQSLHPELVNIKITDKAEPGQEALNVLALILKVGYRAIPVAYGIGLVVATLKLLFAVFYFWFGSRYARVHFESGFFLMWVILLLPFYGFFIFILGNLVLDTFRAILSRLK